MSFQIDGYTDQLVRCLFPSGEVIRVKITCRCQVIFIATIPKSITECGAVPILKCPNRNCGKEFVYYKGGVSSLTSFKTINGVTIPVDLQDFKTWRKET